MIETKISCEVCSGVRQEGNHWLELRYSYGAPYIVKWSKQSEKSGRKHICGAACAHLLLDKHLTALVEERTQ